MGKGKYVDMGDMKGEAGGYKLQLLQREQIALNIQQQMFPGGTNMDF